MYAYRHDIKQVLKVPLVLTAELHYTDTGYEHHQRTSSQQFYNLLYNKFTTNRRKFATSQHLDMSRCWALSLRCGKFVVELLWARPLVVSVGGVVQHVRSRCPCSGVWPINVKQTNVGSKFKQLPLYTWIDRYTKQTDLSLYLTAPSCSSVTNWCFTYLLT